MSDQESPENEKGSSSSGVDQTEQAAFDVFDDGSAAESVDAAMEDSDGLESQLSQAQDALLRSQAELDNYRKRSQREMEDYRRFAKLPLMRDLLPVMDNLQRAIDSAGQSEEGSSLLEGVRMVATHFADTLRQHGCKPIEAADKPFDPHLHEAISQQPSDDQPDNTVLIVTQIGYTLNGRVVRPSQVVISKTPAQ